MFELLRNRNLLAFQLLRNIGENKNYAFYKRLHVNTSATYPSLLVSVEDYFGICFMVFLPKWLHANTAVIFNAPFNAPKNIFLFNAPKNISENIHKQPKRLLSSSFIRCAHRLIRAEVITKVI